MTCFVVFNVNLTPKLDGVRVKTLLVIIDTVILRIKMCKIPNICTQREVVSTWKTHICKQSTGLICSVEAVTQLLDETRTKPESRHNHTKATE